MKKSIFSILCAVMIAAVPSTVFAKKGESGSEKTRAEKRQDDDRKYGKDEQKREQKLEREREREESEKKERKSKKEKEEDSDD